MRDWVKRFGLVVCFLALACVRGFAGSWQEALGKMALPNRTITRENCISVCLTNFQSNDVVKALLFLPGVSDDFYLINRDQPKLNIEAKNLFAALQQLTNATELKLAFEPPFLLVYSSRDLTRPNVVVRNAATAAALTLRRNVAELTCVDRHWDAIQPILETKLSLDIRPKPKSQDAWHFGRHNFAAHGLTNFELLACISLSARTTAAVERKRITFTTNKNR